MQHCLVCPPLYNSFELECDAAGVPGMVAAMLRHLQSLRLMRWGLPLMLPGAATVLLAAVWPAVLPCVSVRCLVSEAERVASVAVLHVLRCPLAGHLPG